ncbi:MAG: methionyl-tRNA formyltransferase [Chloroflexi bacterium]|nr:methionyl-tRNA formyltransferase [Chloroflexota bacterium]
MSRGIELRVLFFGMLGEFSIVPLKRLIESGSEVCGVVVPTLKGEGGRMKSESLTFRLPLLPSPVTTNIVTIARARGIPVVEVSKLSAPESLTAVAVYQPDVICVACFPQIFSPELLALPRFGCLNLHPSLLPAYRGPAPLFWQFRNGETRTGVTIHFMDEGTDTGDIALQREIVFPDGINAVEADRLCAEAGAELVVEALRLLERGECPRRKQSDASRDVPPGSLCHPWPSRADFEITADWSARRAFNFIRGAEAWGMPFEILAGPERIRVRRALAFSPDEKLGEAWHRKGDEAWVQFSPGVLQAETFRRNVAT